MSDYLFIEVESDTTAKPDMLRVRFLSGSVAPFSVAFLVEGFKLVSQTTKRAVHIQKLDDNGEPVFDENDIPVFEFVEEEQTQNKYGEKPMETKVLNVEGETWDSWDSSIDDSEYISQLACSLFGVTQKQEAPAES